MNNIRNIAIWAIIALLLFALFNLFQNPSQRRGSAEVSYTQFLEKVEKGEVKAVTLQDGQITGQLTNGRPFVTYAPPGDPDFIRTLREKNVEIRVKPKGDEGLLPSILLSWFPILLMIGVWLFFMRQMQSNSGKAMGFGKSKARLLTERHGKVTFEDVAGVDEAKEELQEI
ncbi:MAG TPA: cell division protein FtsH, partial [Bryobacterales bacterium]|nr:cell division protein FtsH [Bryobacterales bacterium]